MIKVYFIIILFFVGIAAYSQGIQLNDADLFHRDKKDSHYGFSNETAYIFNTNEDKTVQILEKNFYDSPGVITKDESI